MNADKVKALLDEAQRELNGVTDAEFAAAKTSGNYRALPKLSGVAEAITTAQEKLAGAVKAAAPKAAKEAKPVKK